MQQPSDQETLAAEPAATMDTMVALPSSSPVDLDRATLTLEDGRRYAPREALGQGGMGVVELSADNLIGRDVAIKTLRPQLGDDPRIVERFLREARIQGQLEHPAIVPVYDLGRTTTGQLYFAMKRVKGRTLREILSDLARASELPEVAQRFTRRRLLSAFSQICQAVGFAHSRGVIHRDLKPDNLMFGEHGEVYVLDWGIARLHGRESEAELVDVEHADEHTQHGTIIGTVGYMAPEQARGDHEQIDARADVWSLGAILFELLSLTPLIARAGATEMLTNTILGVDADPSRIDADIPPELAQLCVLATATDPQQRLGSARALSDAIERYLDGDRDAQMRRSKAQDHAHAAELAARRAFETDDLALRRAAARESGVALALDPNNLHARKTLLELFTQPPRQLPEGARAQIEADQVQTLRSFYRESLVAIAVYLPVFFSMLLLNPRELWVVWGAVAAGLVYIGACVHGVRRPRADSYISLILHICISVGLLLFARLFTPLLLLPVLATMNVMVTLGYRGGAPRWSFVASAIAPILAATALELLGVWSPTMVWHDGTLQLRSAMLTIPDSAWLVPGLVLLSVFPILVGTTLIGRVQRLGEDIARDAQVQRWQLEQLMPTD